MTVTTGDLHLFSHIIVDEIQRSREKLIKLK